jgi:sugar lactone lactonase YvrE
VAASGTIDDMIIDGHGRIYVGNLGFDLSDIASASHENCQLILVGPDGTAKIVAQGLRFPNGIAVTANEQCLVVAESDSNYLARFEIRRDGSPQFCCFGE